MITDVCLDELKESLTEIVATPSDGVKCPRCWTLHHAEDNHDWLCDSCCNVILRDFPNHVSARMIERSQEYQLIKHTVFGHGEI